MEPVLACCPAVTVAESAVQVPCLGRRMARVGLMSGAALSYTPGELWLMEAGHLDICFW